MHNFFRNANASPYSLKQRLLGGALIALPLFFSLTGFSLDRAFQRSLISAETDNLQGQIYLLLAAAEINTNAAKNFTVWMPEALHEPRFSQLNSGLYGFIFSPSESEQQPLWRSASAELKENLFTPRNIYNNPLHNQFTVGTHFSQSENYFYFSQDVYWDNSQGALPVRFSIIHSREQFRRELQVYRDQLWLWLTLAGVGLILVQLSLFHWGLRPLRELSSALKAMQSGDNIKLDGNFPSETRPMVDNLNQLLDREFQQRQRYRDGLGNLAHSLKTPLAVMHSHLPHLPDKHLRDQLQEQIQHMDQVVRRQLQRAVLRHSDSREITPIKVTCQRLCNALNKVYRDKNIQFSINLSDDLSFRGDSADLMEILGNLLENACKFCRSTISVTAEPEQEFGKNWIHLSIADDGCGIADSEKEHILKRGQRADSINPGQGIGLSVAAEIVSDYGGALSILDSDLGGANITLRLPS